MPLEHPERGAFTKRLGPLNVGATETWGNGAPTADEPKGSVYSRGDGGAGTSFYIKEAAGVGGWVAAGTTAADLTAIRYQAVMSAQNYYAETFPRVSANPVAIVSGTAMVVAIGLAAGDVVTNLLYACSAGGSVYSGIGMKVGLYDKNLVRLRVSADVSGSFGTGAVTCPLTTPFTILTTDLYYIATLCIATTGPSLYRGSTAAGGGAFTGSTFPAFARNAAATDLVDPLTVGQGTTNAPWTAVN